MFLGAALAANSALGASARSALFPGSPFAGLALWRPGEEALVQDIGWKFARVPVGWHEVLSAPNAIDWRTADARVQGASQAGLRLQISLNLAWPAGMDAPFALDPATRLPADNEGQSAMLRFIDEAVARHASAAEAWGVEEDLSAGSFPGGPTAYAGLLQRVAERVQSGDPEARVVFGAVAFDTMEADARVFYVADVIRCLGSEGGVFQAIELRLIGQNAAEDYRRVPAAVNHLLGQLAGTPYRDAAVALIASAPSSASTGGGEDDQAADVVRRTLTAASLGVTRFYWGGALDGQALQRPASGLGGFLSPLQRSGLTVGPGGESARKKKAFYTSGLLSRLQQRYDVKRTRVHAMSSTLFHAEIPKVGGGNDLNLVWRDYFAAGEGFDSSASVALKLLDYEGPSRQGLHALSLVPYSDGSFPLTELTGKYFDLGGAPVILSQDVAWLEELARP